MEGLTPRLTGAGARSAQGTNTGHENGEAMAGVGVRVEPTVRLGTPVRSDGMTIVLHCIDVEASGRTNWSGQLVRIGLAVACIPLPKFPPHLECDAF